MASKAEFERQLAALNQDKLATLLLETIGLYVEYIQVHGYDEHSAKQVAVSDTLDGIQAAIDLDDAGEL